MATAPTYKNEYLLEVIPKTDLKGLKLILATVKEERKSYRIITYSQVIALITKRLIELSNELSLRAEANLMRP